MSDTPPTGRAGPSDRLSPILIKELRQSMRMRGFLFIFTATQVAMLFVMMFALAASKDGAGAQEAGAFFWMIVAVSLLFLFPISGFSSVSQEYNAKTVDLLLLTRLTSFRVIAGKWFAIICQGLLVVTALIPYFALRYFVGGVNLIEDLMILMALIILSLVLTSFTVALSALKHKIARGILSALGVYAGLMILGGGMGMMFRHGSAPDYLENLITLAIIAIPVIMIALESGAAILATPSFNHEGRRRLWCLVMLGASVTISKLLLAGESVFVLTVPIAIFVALAALTSEHTRAADYRRNKLFNLPVIRPVHRLFFSSGWQSGVFYALLILVGLYGTLVIEKGHPDMDDILPVIAILGAMLTPIPFRGFLRKRYHKNIAAYFIVQAMSIGIWLLVVLIDMTVGIEANLLISFIPSCAFLLTIGDMIEFHDAIYPVCIGTALVILLSIAAALKEMRMHKKQETEALTLLAGPALQEP